MEEEDVVMENVFVMELGLALTVLKLIIVALILVRTMGNVTIMQQDIHVTAPLSGLVIIVKIVIIAQYLHV